MRRFRALALFTCLAVLLSGCAAEVTEPEEQEPASGDYTEQPQVQETAERSNGTFSLAYSSSGSMNPFYGDNVYNLQIMGLLYERLFELDETLQPQPSLCESCVTEDGVTYEVTIKSGVTFHDGSAMTAQDVSYSLYTAMSSANYSARLSGVTDVTVTDTYTVSITLSGANYSFPSLLDVPIVLYGTGGSDAPTGSGPYVFSGDSLTVYSGYRVKNDTLPGRIYLVECDEQELAESFLSSRINLLSFDPTGTVPITIHTLHETRSFATTDFLYLGFNNAYGVTAISTFRRALSYLVDRETICDDIYGGSVLQAPLILSPALDVYDAAWEEGSSYSRQSFLELAEELGLEDSNTDGILEYSGSIRLKLIVNDDSEYKTAVARRVATDMTNMGIYVEVEELSWSDFKDALETGNFSMYIGEARLKADFDVSSLVGDGGSLNYGAVPGEDYDALLADFLGAADVQTRTDAASALCAKVRDEAPLVPIAYKTYQVITHVGEITGGAPSQSNVFRDVAGWTFNNFA